MKPYYTVKLQRMQEERTATDTTTTNSVTTFNNSTKPTIPDERQYRQHPIRTRATLASLLFVVFVVAVVKDTRTTRYDNITSTDGSSTIDPSEAATDADSLSIDNSHHRLSQLFPYLYPTNANTTNTVNSSTTSAIPLLLSTRRQRRLAHVTSSSISNQKPILQSKRLLYIVTTLSEYNSGTRNTVKGSDRLQETLIPVLTEGVSSLIMAGFKVDVQLVCHFTLRPERRDLITQALPESVQLFVWNDATPIGYDTEKFDDNVRLPIPGQGLENRTLHLARQHRFVIKDKLLDYDMFVVFEDDVSDPNSNEKNNSICECLYLLLNPMKLISIIFFFFGENSNHLSLSPLSHILRW